MRCLSACLCVPVPVCIHIVWFRCACRRRSYQPQTSFMLQATFLSGLVQKWGIDYSAEEITAMSGPDVNPDPDRSPMTMGMFATTKQWWQEIGGMDDGLLIWGGENIEISLRTWLCGGEIVVARESIGACVCLSLLVCVSLFLLGIFPCVVLTRHFCHPSVSRISFHSTVQRRSAPDQSQFSPCGGSLD